MMRVDEEHKKQGNTHQPRQGQAARHSEVQGTQGFIRPLLSHGRSHRAGGPGLQVSRSLINGWAATQSRHTRLVYLMV